MTRERRAVLAVMLFILAMSITFFYDPVLALDATAFFIGLYIMFSCISRWWKEPKTVIRRIIGILIGSILLFPLVLIAYSIVPLLSTLYASNYSSGYAAEQLETIVAGLHQWHEKHGQFPAVASYSSTGQPLLSWRVHLLPFLGREELYRQFHLDEPWNSNHNLTLLKSIPNCYRLPGYGQQEPWGGTYFQLIVGPGAVFEHDKQATIPEIKAQGRMESVIIAGIAQEAVPWTKPGDIEFADGKPLALGRVVRRAPATIIPFLMGGNINEENAPGEGNRRYRLAFADGHTDSVVYDEALKRLEPFIKWRGPPPGSLDDLHYP